MKLSYEIQTATGKQTVTQTGSITSGADYAFYVPFGVNYDGINGCFLEVNAVAGYQVMRTRIRSNPECFHIWGTTLNPSWSTVNC